jgi:hypothetical protein
MFVPTLITNTLEQSIENGSLIDISNFAKKLSIPQSIYITKNFYNLLSEECVFDGKDTNDRIVDVLSLFNQRWNNCSHFGRVQFQMHYVTAIEKNLCMYRITAYLHSGESMKGAAGQRIIIGPEGNEYDFI